MASQSENALLQACIQACMHTYTMQNTATKSSKLNDSGRKCILKTTAKYLSAHAQCCLELNNKLNDKLSRPLHWQLTSVGVQPVAVSPQTPRLCEGRSAVQQRTDLEMTAMTSQTHQQPSAAGHWHIQSYKRQIYRPLSRSSLAGVSVSI